MTTLVKLSVLMPVYNESRTLRAIVRRVLDSPVDADIELIAVDDASTDRSYEILCELAASDDRITVLRHEENRGKGAAIRSAIAAMTGDIAVVQDSDLEYDPAEYPKLINPIVTGRADAVFGSRFATSPERRVLLYWHSLGNRFLTWLTNILNDLNLTDMETCYKAVRADVLKDLRLRSERFGIEPEITTRLSQWGALIYEVPISYHGRSYAEGKNIGWRDGVQAIWLLFKFRFFDTRFSDRSGHQTLESMARAPGLARWTFRQFEGHLGEAVLDAGSGRGSFADQLLDRERLVVVDHDRFHVESLHRRYGHLENVEVFQGDLEDPGLYTKLGPQSFDTVVCINVLEHLPRPDRAIEGFAAALRPGGKALILVPAHQWLFSEMDRSIDHVSRFEEGDLRNLIEAGGLSISTMYQFNRLGVVGWLTNKWMKRPVISPWQMRLFALLMPLARSVERFSFLPGLSWIVVAQKL
jgi:glycosyltransferase involved in cell wall biosynthesis/phospholipid N-methyltransferase